jgi:uncharacterized protein YecE (DUF72 family)
MSDRAGPETSSAHSASRNPQSAILVGVAGWSYPDWRGCFYPRTKDKTPDLVRVARIFDLVEINSPFYRLPEPGVAEKWLRLIEDRPGFRFTTKVPKDLTHDRELEPAALIEGCRLLREALRPLEEAGRLAAVLLQFPFYFQDDPPIRDRIRRLRDALQPLPVSVEVRHRSFFFGPQAGSAPGEVPPLATGPGSAIAFLEEIGAGMVNIDLPAGQDTVPPTSINTSPIGYVRLHGRNARSWFDPRAGRDQKYDYLYRPEELAGWKDRILRLGERTVSTLVILNNHFRAQAPANAIELLHLLGRTPAGVPATLVAAYPQLEGLLGAAARAGGA